MSHRHHFWNMFFVLGRFQTFCVSWHFLTVDGQTWLDVFVSSLDRQRVCCAFCIILDYKCICRAFLTHPHCQTPSDGSRTIFTSPKQSSWVSCHFGFVFLWDQFRLRGTSVTNFRSVPLLLKRIWLPQRNRNIFQAINQCQMVGTLSHSQRVSCAFCVCVLA